MDTVKTKEFLYRKALMIALSINIVVLLVIVSITDFRYETNDDFALARLVANHGWLTVGFTNYYLCFFISLLQKILPFVNAWVIAQVGFSFIAFTSISFVFLSKGTDRQNFFRAAAIPVIFAYNHYCEIQFTFTSALLLSAGALLIYHALRNGGDIRVMLIGFLLLYVGAGFRFDNVKVTLVFLFVVIVEGVFFERKGVLRRVRNRIRARKTVCICCVVLFVGLFAGQWASEAKNLSTDELRAYAAYNSARSSFIDYPVPDYEGNAEFYEGLGISASDFYLMLDWYFDYDTVASAENFEAIAAKQGDEKEDILRDVATPFVRMIAQNVKDHTFQGYHIVLIALMLILGGVIFGRRWLKLALILAVLALGAYGYLFYIGRPIYRAMYIIDLSAILWMLFAADRFYVSETLTKRLAKIKDFIAYPAICVLLSIPLIMGALAMDWNPDKEEMSKNADELRDYTVQREDSYFVFDLATMDPYIRTTSAYLNPLTPLPPDYQGNVAGFGGWETLSPHILDAMKRYGLNNLYGDIIDNDTVCVIDNYCYERMEQFFNDHYAKPGEVIYYEPVDEIGGYKIWQVKSRKGQANDPI
jgi:hypothetical protein